LDELLNKRIVEQWYSHRMQWKVCMSGDGLTSNLLFAGRY